MSEVMQIFTNDAGELVRVEIETDDPGFELVSRRDGPVQAAQTLAAVLDSVLPAARTILEKAQTFSPLVDEFELGFGVRLTASAGFTGIIASSGEGHFQLRVRCRTHSS